MSNDTTTKVRPAFRIYGVTKDTEGKADWTEIGAAWGHKDGKGFNLKFSAPAAEGASIVLRMPKAKEEVAA